MKGKTIKKTRYTSVQEMRDDLIKFLVNYNLYRRHGSWRRELKVKTPFDAVTKGYYSASQCSDTKVAESTKDAGVYYFQVMKKSFR